MVQDSHNPREVSATRVYIRAVVDIVRSLTGLGLLSLPGAVAIFVQAERDLYISLVCSVLVLVASGYCFYAVGAVCERTDTHGYCDAWRATGLPSTWFPRVAMTLTTWACGVAHFVMLGDVMPSLLSRCAWYLPEIAQWLVTRSCCIAAASIAMYPVVMRHDLSRIMHAGWLNNLASAYVVVALLIRSADGSYGAAAAQGDPLQSAPADAAACPYGNMPALRLMVLVSQLSAAFMAHPVSAPIRRKLSELASDGQMEDESRTWALVVAAGFAGGGLVNIGSMALGYSLFGAASTGNLLQSFHKDDPLGLLGQVLVAVAAAACFPLVFRPQQGAVLAALDVSGRALWRLRLVTAGQLAANAAPAMLVHDLGLVHTLTGALLGSVLIFIAPAMMDILSERRGCCRTWVDVSVALFGLFAMASGCIACYAAYA
mmetsp:Transcript_64529/g.178929  ORF Transcript_64529/g.178929 Transcript_64529/m.178929 type:complete len:430 (+) Transcript_64529:47-1336(+)